jgi:UDP-sugar pyrophosphorylase
MAAALLGANWSILDVEEQKSADYLVGAGQDHLFSKWSAPGTDDDEKHLFFKQVTALDGNYPGGISAYCDQARKLLKAAASGANPMQGVTKVEVPTGVNLEYGDEQFKTFERLGMEQMPGVCFVLVAGGLGERLGYPGIKVALPTELCSNECYLQFYIQSILALQARCNARPGANKVKLPLAIMVSGDTGERTIKLLKDNRNFGMDDDQVSAA